MPPKKKSAKKGAAKKAAGKTPSQTLITEQLAPLVIRLRRENVILDADIADLYGVPVSRLNQAVKRNSERFPADFMFQLTEEEIVTSNSDKSSLRSQTVILKTGDGVDDEPKTLRCQTGTSSLKSQFVISNSRGGRRTLPYAFTEPQR